MTERTTDRRPPTVRRGRRSPVFHGWRIVGVLALTETISWGVLYYAFAVFQVPMGAELGLTSAHVSGAFSLAVLMTGVAGVWVGRWLDARGPRGLMTAGAAVSALLVAAWSQVHTGWQLYLVFAGIGLARATVLYDPAFAVIVRWFDRRRAKALLAVTLVAGFASTVALPTSNALIEAFGWRKALLVLAAALAALTVIPHWVVLRRDPADLGLQPDGTPTRQDRESARPTSPEFGPSLRHAASWAARQPAFRWYAAAFASQSTAVIIVAVHLVPYLLERGHTAGFAAAATGALGALSVTGRLVLTGAARAAPLAVVTAAIFAIQAGGVAVLLLTGDTPLGAAAFVGLFGIGFGVGTVARPALMARTFGVTGYATISGLLGLVVTLMTTAGAYAAGLARTASGAYHASFLAVLALCALAAASVLRAGRVSAGGVGASDGGLPPQSEPHGIRAGAAAGYSTSRSAAATKGRMP